MKVMKFGGGCLKDEAGLRRVLQIISAEKKPPVVVVSAIFGVTDRLFAAMELARQGVRSVKKSVAELSRLHVELCQRVVADEEIRCRTVRRITEAMEKIERLLYGIAYTEEITPAIRSHLASFGERLAALLLAAVLNSHGVASEAFDTDRMGMITDECAENATVELKEFRRRFKKTARRLATEGLVGVFTGFFGRTPSGKIATFGRNGSDYSAAVLAYGLHADKLEIWKDVEGFMSADPKFVRGAHKIDRLSYHEAAELSYFGAKILHPRTLEPLAGLPIALRIKSILEPKSAGTLIQEKGYEKEDVIKSVTANRQIAVLRIEGPGVGYKPGIIGAVGDALSARGINIYSVITAQTCINLLLDKKDGGRAHEALRRFHDGVIGKISLLVDRSLIAVVGEGMRRTRGVAARVFRAVSDAEVNVEMIASGASEVASYFIVHSRDAEKVIAAVHYEFFNGHR